MECALVKQRTSRDITKSQQPWHLVLHVLGFVYMPITAVSGSARFSDLVNRAPKFEVPLSCGRGHLIPETGTHQVIP